MIYDLSGGARRLVERANGYDGTTVAGAVVMSDGVYTGARPGTFARGPQAA